MFGECQEPRWSDRDVSLLVGMVAVGIGVGSPLVGYLSGGKIEVGLVPIGSIGMAIAAGAAAFLLGYVPGLIVCIVLIGLFTGFYLVPLYALLQHRAPKTSKGDWVATSNFLNVTGAIVATVLFWLMSQAAVLTGLAPQLPTTDVLTGPLEAVTPERERDRPQSVQVGDQTFEAGPTVLIDPVRTSLKHGEMVTVDSFTYKPGGTKHYHLRPSGEVQRPVYDQRRFPRCCF